MVVAVGIGEIEEDEEGVDVREETVDTEGSEAGEGTGGVMLIDGIREVGR
jgi:hypothetical protein